MKINLGCGHKKIPDFINIDIRPEVNPDLVSNIEWSGLESFKDNSVDEIRAFDFLEHIRIEKTVFVIEEIYRVLKPGGRFEHFTPSTDGRGAFQDPTHLSFWNINSWLYFSDTQINKEYGFKAQFRIERLQDLVTDTKVIHTHGIMYAIKEQSQ